MGIAKAKEEESICTSITGHTGEPQRRKDTAAAMRSSRAQCMHAFCPRDLVPQWLRVSLWLLDHAHVQMLCGTLPMSQEPEFLSSFNLLYLVGRSE